MAKFKVIGEIDRHDGNGVEEYPIFMSNEGNSKEAEDSARHWFCTERPNWSYYGAIKITEF